MCEDAKSRKITFRVPHHFLPWFQCFSPRCFVPCGLHHPQEGVFSLCSAFEVLQSSRFPLFSARSISDDIHTDLFSRGSKKPEQPETYSKLAGLTNKQTNKKNKTNDMKESVLCIRYELSFLVFYMQIRYLILLPQRVVKSNSNKVGARLAGTQSLPCLSLLCFRLLALHLSTLVVSP